LTHSVESGCRKLETVRILATPLNVVVKTSVDRNGRWTGFAPFLSCRVSVWDELSDAGTCDIGLHR